MSPSSKAVLSAAEVRQQFLDFFSERGHRAVPSSPTFPQDDPTLLFTNAGMNQFKDVFLGTGQRDYTRAVDTQKCIRVSGKHNDLEEVGVDTYHHTFFEMLGNWSFGDYFKREAIEWAWELLTGVWGIEKERLWATVFGGDEALGLGPDEEAEELWREGTDIDPSHILRFDKRDNFWEMGETGPCGPCSEIHIDRGGPGSDPTDGADPKIGVNAGNERFIELWNLVFMQFNRLDDGSLRELPAKHVDTGMGFERVTAVLQGKLSNYDTDIFTPLFARIGQLAKRTYGEQERTDIAFRVIADHLRAVTAACSDGVLPSNTGRGYVMRRLIRRAARFGRQDLSMEEPFLHQVVPTVAEVLGGAFPEMRERSEHVQLLVREEEEAFGRTLGRGLVRFEELAGRVEGSVLPGDLSFELYATYGFPRDLVELMARERELGFDAEGWERAEKAHQDASRSEGRFKQLLSAEELEAVGESTSTYHAEGERAWRLETRIELLGRRPTEDGGEELVVVLPESPFYAESGGQVGDRGTLADPGGAFRIEVTDTQKVGGAVAHLGRLAEGQLPEPASGAAVLATVDVALRDATRRNHTATHLLHQALREVLGEHVVQQGSYVGPDRLRFDFSHPRGVEPEELDRIEAMVNERVFWNAEVTTTVEDLEAAKERGVTAIFGEKYDARVRVLDVGGWSTELCGGTHVRAAGDIGPFVILSERAISAGVRRLEAVTGRSAVEVVQHQRSLLGESAQKLKAAVEELPARIEQLQKQLKEAKKQKKSGAQSDLREALERVKEAAVEHGGVLTAVVDFEGLDVEGLRELGTRAKSLSGDLSLVLFGRAGGRVPFLILCQGKALEAGLKAGELAKEVGKHLGGGGGGRPDSAQGQGQSQDGIPAAIEALGARLAEVLA